MKNMKTLLSLLFVFVCVVSQAQFHNVKGIRIVPRTSASDSTTISNVGQISFDADDDKIRFNDGSGWFSFLKEGATLPSWPLSGNASLTGDVNILGLSTHDVYIGTSASRVAEFRSQASSVISFNRQVSNDASRATWRMDGNLMSFLRGNYLGLTTEQRIQAEGDSLYIFVGDGSADVFSRIKIDPEDGMVYEDSTTNSYGIRYSGVVTPTDSTLITKSYVDGRFDGIEVPEGTNKTMGIATLSSGTVTVNTTAVTATSRIFLTVNGGTLTNVGTPYVSARSAGTSFTITSTNGSDASDVAWIIINPAP